MSTTEHIGQTFSREAGEDMTAKQHYIVQLTAAGLIEVAEGATDLVVGVLQNTPDTGEQAVYAYTGVHCCPVNHRINSIGYNL